MPKTDYTSRPPKIGQLSRAAYGVLRRLLGSRHVAAYYSAIGRIRQRHDLNVHFFPCPPTGMDYTIEKVLCELGIPMVGQADDIRVAVIGRVLPYVTLKRRWRQQQFHNVDITAHVVEIGEALSSDEQAKVLELARAIGLDYGEMDGLRDRSTGKFYVVDINKTPFGPASRMAFFPKRRAVKRLAEVFEAEFLS